MSTNPTYPGVYIEEVPSEVRTITGVATSITAFIGRALRGPVDEPILIHSFADFSRSFGGLWRASLLSYAVQHFFLNGGKDALIVRVFNPNGNSLDDCTALYELPCDGDLLSVVAASPGLWGNRLHIFVDHHTRDEGEDNADTDLFNLTIEEVDDGGEVVGQETFLNISRNSDDPRFVTKVLEQRSGYLRVEGDVPAQRPGVTEEDHPPAPTREGSDGIAIDSNQVSHPDLEAERRGIWALDQSDLFNLLCIPPYESEVDVDAATWNAALSYCEGRRAMVIMDPPLLWSDPAAAAEGKIDDADTPLPRSRNGAVYYPRIQLADPLQENRLATFAPCGAIAGICARTDSERGVWKAPAGQDATLSGVSLLDYKMTDAQNGTLNPLGINCLRTFPVAGHVVWGARTLVGADRLASEWKYLPVRRLALYLEESLYRGTQWVIFEPNDEPLWAQIRLNVGAFMHNLFRQGAFQGSSPRDAYFVKCDSETTTQNDIDQGIVNLLVGFAPLKPAEFLVIKISQIAGEIQT